MEPNTLKSRFLGHLANWLLQQPQVCSPHIPGQSLAGSFSPITNDLKLHYFAVSVTKAATDHLPLPISPEEPTTVHPGTPVTGLIPPVFTSADLWMP